MGGELRDGARLGPYQILAPLGAGGMGAVYKARDTRLGRIVAVKTLLSAITADPAFLERFDREARAISQLNHPHICTLHDVGSDDDVHYLVLEYLEGETLAERLARGALPLHQSLTIGVQIADALAHAHGQGIVHRDLKPANVMLTKDGAKLLDFGLAKPAAPAVALQAAAVTVSAPLTAEGSLLGTLQYMSPEQVEGRDADARSDIFALGAVLYEMVTGRRAFEGKSAASVIAAILEREPRPLSSLQKLAPSALDHVVARCLAKDPDERWQNSGDVMRELKWVATAPTMAAALMPPRSRERIWRALALVSALALAVSIAWLLLRRAEPPSIADSSQPLQFTIAPPSGSSWGPISPVAISPNGRQLAFVARLPQSVDAGLWIRSLDRLDAMPLAGTEHAQYPFWSPDGRSIGFFVRGQLKRARADGTDVQTICAVGEGFGGTWNSSDVIVYASRDGLFRVSAAGGEPVMLREASPETPAYTWPLFLPGGQRFLYVARTLGARPNQLRAATLDDPVGREIGPASSNLAYMESGHLILARQRTLIAQRFDAEKLELVGEPQVVAQDVAATSYLQRAVFSVSVNGTLVYRRNPLRETQLAWFDRSGQRLTTVGPAGSLSAPALAPDGKTVAFVRTDPSSRTPDIWLMDVTRGVPTRFTFDAGPSAAPVWSPDGTRVLYAAGMRRLVAKSARGGNEEVIANLETPGAAYANDWSADGRHILFDTRSSSGDLWVLPLDAPRQPRAFVTSQQYHELHQRISPNGRWVAYESDESGSNEIYVRPFDGGRSERVSSSGGIWPQWRRGDGSELYYLAPDGQLMVVDVARSNELTVSAPRPLFTVNSVETDRYSVTADGQKFLMVVPVSNEPLGLTVTVNWPATIGR